MTRLSGNAGDPIAILMEEHKVVLGKLDSLEEALKMVKGNVTSEAVTGVNGIINSIERDFTLHSLRKEPCSQFWKTTFQGKEAPLK